MIKIKVIGVGGCGVNTVNRLKDKKLPGVELLAVNTDSQSLMMSSITEKLQIGPKLTKGHGSGGSSEIGRMAANESRKELSNVMEGVDLIFIAAGLGGGTGAGASPTIAQLAREAGATTIAIVTIPFLFEGQGKLARAEEELSILENEADTVIVIPNQKLFSLGYEDTSLQDAFENADLVLIKVIRSITDLITKPGLINLDFSNVRAIVNKGGRGFFGFGEASGEERVKKLVEDAFTSSLLEDVDIKSACSCLVNIYGSEKLSFKEVNLIMENISNRLSPKVNIVFGVTVENSLKDTIRMTVIATGIKCRTLPLKSKKDIRDEKKWPDVFDYKEEFDSPSFLRRK
jgi:cell division protein FtsZ